VVIIAEPSEGLPMQKQTAGWQCQWWKERRSWRSAPIGIGAAKLQIVGDCFVFGGDHVGASANALAANLASVARDQPEHFVMALAAE
jgi:hypothetical protein